MLERHKKVAIVGPDVTSETNDTTNRGDKHWCGQKSFLSRPGLFSSVLLDASSKLRGRRQLVLICAFRVAIEYATHCGQLSSTEERVWAAVAHAKGLKTQFDPCPPHRGGRRRRDVE